MLAFLPWRIAIQGRVHGDYRLLFHSGYCQRFRIQAWEMAFARGLRCFWQPVVERRVFALVTRRHSMSEHLADGLAADAKPLRCGALALVLNHHGKSHFGV